MKPERSPPLGRKRAGSHSSETTVENPENCERKLRSQSEETKKNNEKNEKRTEKEHGTIAKSGMTSSSSRKNGNSGKNDNASLKSSFFNNKFALLNEDSATTKGKGGSQAKQIEAEQAAVKASEEEDKPKREEKKESQSITLKRSELEAIFKRAAEEVGVQFERKIEKSNKDLKEDIKKEIGGCKEKIDAMCKKYEEFNRRMNKAEKEAEEEAKARKDEDRKLKREIEKLRKELSEVKERLGEVEEKQEPEGVLRYEDCKRIFDEIWKEENERIEEARADGRPEDREGHDANKRLRQEEEKRISELEWKQEETERERIRNNIVFIGLEEEIKDKAQVEQWCEENLDIGISFMKIWEIKGKKRKLGARCQSKEEKELVMAKKSSLKMKESKVFIEHDTTWRERRNKEEVWHKAVALKKQGIKVKIGYNKLRVDENGDGDWNEVKWLEKRKKWVFGEKGEEVELGGKEEDEEPNRQGSPFREEEADAEEAEREEEMEAANEEE